MPQNITDVDTFTDPITAPAGADALDETEVLAGLQGVANRTRNIYNILDLPLAAIVSDVNAVCGVSDVDATGNSYWGPNGGSIMNMQTTGLASSTAIFYEISHLVREGGTITKVEALVKPASGHTTGIVLKLDRVTTALPFTGPPGNPTITNVATSAASSGTTNQLLTTGTVAEATDGDGAGLAWVVTVTSGDNSAALADTLYGLRLYWTPTKITNR